jgi:hypothetical protein
VLLCSGKELLTLCAKEWTPLSFEAMKIVIESRRRLEELEELKNGVGDSPESPHTMEELEQAHTAISLIFE